jgi:hypothetical protein
MHIERLVLDGVDLPAQGAGLLRAEMRSELQRLLVKEGLPSALWRGATFESLAGDPMSFSAGAKPATIGGSIARAVHGGLTR